MRAAILLLLIAFLPTALADPPSPHNVAGFVFHNGTGAGVANGIPVLILDTTTGTNATTQVFAPPVPQLAGAYSATISGTDGDTLEIYAWNATHYGNTSATLSSTTNANVTLSSGRAAEPNVTILAPPNSTTYEGGTQFNVTVNITVVGADGICNATISFGNSSVLGAGETKDLGAIPRGGSVRLNFSVTPLLVGWSSALVTAACSPTGPILEARTSDSIGNITIVDTAAPNITLISPANNTLRTIDNIVNLTYLMTDFSTVSCSLIIDSVLNQTVENATKGTNQGFERALTNGAHLWSVNCTDAYGNAATAGPYNITITIPDLSTEELWYDGQLVESYNITLHANVTNLGLLDAGPFTVRFERNGMQLANVTVPGLAVGANVTVNTTMTLDLGQNAVLAIADADWQVNETYESNNNLTLNITIPLYQYYYGNIVQNVHLDASANDSFYIFLDDPSFAGYLFMADTDSLFSFQDLVALGRTMGGTPTSDDFSDIDIALNTTPFADSIQDIWTGGTEIPLGTGTVQLSTGNITNVPTMNSTGTASFLTGILWDSADDTGNAQFDQTDAEDLVFVAFINQSQVGSYGTYDYEAKIPSRLKEYKPGSSTLAIYYEIQ